MRHKRAGFKLKRDASARRALLRGLVTSVIECEASASSPRSEGEGGQAAGRQDDHARQAGHPACPAAGGRFLLTPASVKKLFDKLGPRFAQRNGGYSQIVRVGWRKGDGAEQAILELVGSQLVKRADDRAKRREERLKAMNEGREAEESAEKE